MTFLDLSKERHNNLKETGFSGNNLHNTGNDRYSGDLYSGNDGYSGPKPPDDAILFTVSGITVIADEKFGNFDLKNAIFMQIDHFIMRN